MGKNQHVTPHPDGGLAGKRRRQQPSDCPDNHTTRGYWNCP